MSSLTRSRLLSPKERPDAVLCDWDDTLFDHDAYEHKLWHKLIDECADEPKPTIAVADKLWHENPDACCKTYFSNYTENDLIQIWIGLQKNMPQDELAMMPGALDILESLKSKGVPIILVSNKNIDVINRELEHFGLGSYFEAVVGGDNDKEKRKPHPLPILKAYSEANKNRMKRGESRIVPNNLWYVGDHLDDAKALTSVGLQGFIVGHKYRQPVKDHFPDIHIEFLDTIADFKPYVDAIPDKKISTMAF